MSRKRRTSRSRKSKAFGFRRIVAGLALVGALAAGYGSYQGLYSNIFMSARQVENLEEIPEYEGQPYVVVNENEPSFCDEDKNGPAYEYYSELDVLGRCGFAEAKISRELMPVEERGAIGSVRPSGWHTVKYGFVDGKYLYNRCHLIGYQLTAENANEKNLEGMLSWENEVAEYIERTGDAVMYRVTPVFEGANLLASGVQMEAESVGSHDIRFNVYVFNVQPGIRIDYTTGESREE